METTLEAALDRLFGSGTTRGMRLQTDVPGPGEAEAAAADRQSGAAGAPTAASGSSPELQGLAAEARTHYERAIAAQREGNWAAYGEEIRKLGDVLERMRR